MADVVGFEFLGTNGLAALDVLPAQSGNDSTVGIVDPLAPESGAADVGTSSDGVLAPICVPITSPEIIISTRRFCCRPAAVVLSATGFAFPNPVAVTDPGSIPCDTRYACTPSARFSERV